MTCVSRSAAAEFNEDIGTCAITCQKYTRIRTVEILKYREKHAALLQALPQRQTLLHALIESAGAEFFVNFRPRGGHATNLTM